MQLLIVGTIVFGAALYVGWAVWRTWVPKAGRACGGCGSGCGAKRPANGPTFVPVEALGVRRSDR